LVAVQQQVRGLQRQIQRATTAKKTMNYLLEQVQGPQRLLVVQRAGGLQRF
jgi:hypothetical protein